MPKTPQEMWDAIFRNLPKNTGRSLDEWLALIRSEGLQGRSATRDWLKTKHGLGHSTASVIAGEAIKPADFVQLTSQEQLDAQYSGAKAPLRSIYDKLAAATQSLGPDALVDPRQTYVALRRRRQFGIIQATNATCVDLGLTLTGVESQGRLETVKNLGSDRITHRIRFTSVDEVDGDALNWLREAYTRDA